MTLLIAAGLIALLAAGWVVHPILFRRWGLLGDAVSADIVDRESRKRVALAALKDVEYDHAAGKLDETDYREVRDRLELEALHAVRAAESPHDSHSRHQCGFVNPPASRFCAGCGLRIA